MAEARNAGPRPSSVTYAVPDLHGRFDLLEAALVAIADDAGDATSRTVVFLGDYVDRGPRSAEILERLGQGAPDGWRWICLKGNHEAMMARAPEDREELGLWVGNGGDATLASYGDRRGSLPRHLAWIEALPSIHYDRHRVFVHAGVDPAVPLDAQAEDDLLWKRYPAASSEGYGSRHLVHGHDPDVDGPLLHAGRSALDTLAWRTGRLVVAVFDDARAGAPVDTIEIRGAPAER